MKCLWIKILSVILLLLLLVPYIRFSQVTEGFKARDPFDESYAKMYDKVFNPSQYYQKYYEEITKFLNERDKVLDAGTGTGKLYELLEKSHSVTGVDRSESMIRRAKIRAPSGNFKIGDLKDEKLIKPGSLDAIVFAMDGPYHNNINQLSIIFSNFYYWLKPKGYFFITVYDKNKFDPSPMDHSQIYENDGIKKSVTYFNKFTHIAWYKNNKYHEKYVDKDGNKKFWRHTLDIPTKKDMIDRITSNSFKLKDIITFDKFYINDQELHVYKKIKRTAERMNF